MSGFLGVCSSLLVCFWLFIHVFVCVCLCVCLTVYI